jgi:hypothetical protein
MDLPLPDNIATAIERKMEAEKPNGLPVSLPPSVAGSRLPVTVEEQEETG